LAHPACLYGGAAAAQGPTRLISRKKIHLSWAICGVCEKKFAKTSRYDHFLALAQALAFLFRVSH